MNLGAPELLIILVVMLVLFGGAKLPQLARSLGQAKSEFEKGVRADTTPAPPSSSAVPTSSDPAEMVTMSRADLDKLIDERIRAAISDPSRREPPGG